jgi:hypothetical protein
MALHSLHQHNQNLAAEDNLLPLATNGFVLERVPDLFIVGGNGVFTMLISLYPNQEEWQYELSVLDHATTLTSHFGYFSAYGCRPIRKGGVLCPLRLYCGIAQNGSHLVLFGPKRYTSHKSAESETPVIAIYRLAPPEKLFERRFNEDTSFIKCDPDGIALSPVGLTQGHYLVAIVTRDMVVILLNVTTLKRSRLQLQLVKPQTYIKDEYSTNGKCIDFSPKGRLISVMCFLQTESVNACLIVDVTTLEPLYWMEVDGTFMCLRWLFPMFSASGTEMAVCTYNNYGNTYDDSRYEMRFYEIPGIPQTLKILCGAVILECVARSKLHKLNLPQELIEYLRAGFERKICTLL